MNDEPDDSPVTEEELVEARKRHATMEPCIPPLFSHAVTGNGVQGDVLIGYDKLPDSTPK